MLFQRKIIDLDRNQLKMCLIEKVPLCTIPLETTHFQLEKCENSWGSRLKTNTKFNFLKRRVGNENFLAHFSFIRANKIGFLSVKRGEWESENKWKRL